MLRGNGLDERVVMEAINRAKRRFFLRPSYISRHLGDVARLAVTKQAIVWQVASRMLFGAPVTRGASVQRAEQSTSGRQPELNSSGFSLRQGAAGPSIQAALRDQPDTAIGPVLALLRGPTRRTVRHR